MIVNVLGDVGEQAAAGPEGLAAENDDVDRHIVSQQKFADRIHRHTQRLVLRIAENARGDQRKRHSLAAVLLRERKAVPVAGDERVPLAAAAAVPHGSDGVDHIFARQTVRPRDLRLAGLAAVQRPALFKKPRSRRPVDAAVHSAAAEQRLVGCIYDGVHRHLSYIVANNTKRHILTAFSFSS